MSSVANSREGKNHYAFRARRRDGADLSLTAIDDAVIDHCVITALEGPQQTSQRAGYSLRASETRHLNHSTHADDNVDLKSSSIRVDAFATVHEYLQARCCWLDTHRSAQLDSIRMQCNSCAAQVRRSSSARATCYARKCLWPTV